MTSVAFIKPEVPIRVPLYQPLVLWGVHLTSNTIWRGSEVKAFRAATVTVAWESVSLEF